MAAYVVRRLLYGVPILFGITLVAFLLFNVVAPDPALTKVGKHASPERIAEVRRELGTDKPLFWSWDSQYVRFLGEVVTFDFGRSWATQQRVGSMILAGVGPSLSLALPAFALEVVLAVSLALLCAFRRNSAADVSIVVLAVAGISIPSLSYIIFGQYYLAYEWKLFPVFGYERSLGAVNFLALPILIWIVLAIGSEVRFYRAVMLEEMRQDYVRTAAAKGLRTGRILFRHILKNASIQIITRVVITLPFLILGSLLIEMFFGIPGLGSLTVDALNRNDFPVVKAMVVVGAILYILFSILTDVFYALVDPRIRLR
jgi:peptide/nickel transport system permease protein